MKTEFVKWGNSLALRRRRYSLGELLEGITPEDYHPEVEWGPPVGNEVW
jgi:antitoxin MazE